MVHTHEDEVFYTTLDLLWCLHKGVSSSREHRFKLVISTSFFAKTNKYCTRSRVTPYRSTFISAEYAALITGSGARLVYDNPSDSRTIVA